MHTRFRAELFLLSSRGVGGRGTSGQMCKSHAGTVGTAGSHRALLTVCARWSVQIPRAAAHIAELSPCPHSHHREPNLPSCPPFSCAGAESSVSDGSGAEVPPSSPVPAAPFLPCHGQGAAPGSPRLPSPAPGGLQAVWPAHAAQQTAGYQKR